MKKIAVLFAVVAVFAGCSNDNKITLNNISDGPIYFNFRATRYIIDVDETESISDIPNGTYTYATTFGIPAGAKTYSIEGTAGAGSLIFDKKDTQILLIYSATLSDAGEYKVGATMTSSRSISSSPTSP
jgi:hypothetical protein